MLDGLPKFGRSFISPVAEPNLIVEDWGLIDYRSALASQEKLVEQVFSGDDHLIFCTHPPVVTLGRATETQDVDNWCGERVEVSRGGRATYHGPSQLVVYPIINLARENRRELKSKDIHHYLRLLERTVIQVLKDVGVEAFTREQPTNPTEQKKNFTGVWVPSLKSAEHCQKIASIGIAVRKWVTYHGIALNVNVDPTAFSGIKPCGFSKNDMVSLEELGVSVPLSQIKESFVTRFKEIL